MPPSAMISNGHDPPAKQPIRPGAWGNSLSSTTPVRVNFGCPNRPPATLALKHEADWVLHRYCRKRGSPSAGVGCRGRSEQDWRYITGVIDNRESFNRQRNESRRGGCSGHSPGRTLFFRTPKFLAPLAVLTDDSRPDPQDVCASDVSCQPARSAEVWLDSAGKLFQRCPPKLVLARLPVDRELQYRLSPARRNGSPEWTILVGSELNQP